MLPVVALGFQPSSECVVGHEDRLQPLRFPQVVNIKHGCSSCAWWASLAAFSQKPLRVLNSVFECSAACMAAPATNARHLLAKPRMAALVENDNWRRGPIDSGRLAPCRGRASAAACDQLQSRGLTPESLDRPSQSPHRPVHHPIGLRETHDIRPMLLTGFWHRMAPVKLGAAGLQPGPGALPPWPVVLIFGGLLSACRNDEPLEPCSGPWPGV